MITRAPRRGRNALRGRVRHGDFAAAFARAQAGGATVHLNAADVAAIAVAEHAFVGIRGFLPLGKENFGGKLDVHALIGGDGCDGHPSGVVDHLDRPGLRRVDAAFLMWRPSPGPNTRSSGFAVFCHWVKRILGESLTCTPLLAETDAMVTHLAL